MNDTAEICHELKDETILIVDDDEDFTDVMNEQLKSAGINVVGVANNAESAMKMVEKLDPSFLILDIHLKKGGMDGIELARKINEIEPRPILFLTNFNNSDYIERARKSGVFTYLIKPDSISKIIPSIVLTLGHFREMMSLRATLDDARENISNTKIIEQAINILMTRNRISEQEAFDVISGRSRLENKPIVAVAQTIIAAGF